MTDEDVGADFAHPARVYDYWLGGTDNFSADRAAAEQVMRFMPEILDTVRGNRRFLVRRGRLPAGRRDPPVHRHRQRAAEQPERARGRRRSARRVPA
jgi:hypothetical protein